LAKLRELHKQRKNDKILKEARAMLSEGGLDGLSMRKLAERSEMAVTTLYRFFPSREELIGEVFDEGLGEIQEIISQLKSDHPLEQMESIVSVGLSNVAKPSSDLKALVLVGTHQYWRKHTLKYAKRMAEMLLEPLEQARADNILKDELDSLTMAIHIFRQYQMAMEDWAQGRSNKKTMLATALYGLWISLLSQATDEYRAEILSKLSDVEPEVLGFIRTGR